VISDVRGNKLLSVLCAYALAIVAAIGGIILRFAFHLPAERPIDRSHCYVWESSVATALVAFLVVSPLSAGFVRSRGVRWVLIVAISLCALVLATFLWSYSVQQPCFNEFGVTP
jgi:hypothetical protein